MFVCLSNPFLWDCCQKMPARMSTNIRWHKERHFFIPGGQQTLLMKSYFCHSSSLASLGKKFSLECLFALRSPCPNFASTTIDLDYKRCPCQPLIFLSWDLLTPQVLWERAFPKEKWTSHMFSDKCSKKYTWPWLPFLRDPRNSPPAPLLVTPS